MRILPTFICLAALLAAPAAIGQTRDAEPPKDTKQSRDTKPPRDVKPVRATTPPRDTGAPAGLKSEVPEDEQLGPGKIPIPTRPYDDRVAATPDVNQHATYASFRKDDQMDDAARARHPLPEGYSYSQRFFPSDFCGPAAVANHIIWLEQTAYPDISAEPNAFAAAMKLAFTLGWSYMKTVTEPEEDDDGWSDIPEGKGTKAHDLLNGAIKFLREKNVPIKAVRVTSSYDMELKGKVNTRGAPFFFDIEKPDEQTIHSALHRRSIVVTLHGHFVPLTQKIFEAPNSIAASPQKLRWSAPRLERKGGHYAAAVGYGTGSHGTFKPDRTLYHDSSARNRGKKFQTVYDWNVVTKDDFATNPVLVRYHKGGSLEREHLRCPFAPDPIKDGRGQNWSLECRGTLHGHAVAHWSNQEKNEPEAPLRGGMPDIGSEPSSFYGADRVEILEAVFEIEIEEPTQGGPVRQR